MVGLIAFAVSSFALTELTADWAFWDLFPPQALRGVALMCCMVPINMLALGTLPPDRIKNASGLFNLTRNLGGAFGLAGINTILQSRTDLHVARIGDSVRWGAAIAEERLGDMTASLQGVLGPDAATGALQRLGNMVHRQALVLAFADIFLIVGVLFASMVLLVPLLRRPGGPGGGGGGGH